MDHTPENQKRRKSIRLKNYDYSQNGGYFITICTQDKKCLFGQIENGKMLLNEYGGIVLDCWNDLPKHYKHIELDYFVIMPNHLHGILIIKDVGVGFKPVHGLAEIIRGLKTFSARKINQLRNLKNISVWQRGYYEHIIRDEADLNDIQEYILNNPLKWEMDKLFMN